MLYDYNGCERRDTTLTLENGVTVNGEFIDDRIDPDTIPTGKHWYQVRHTEDDWCEMASIAKSVLVNFCGTFITDTEIDFSGFDIAEIDITDWGFND